MCRHLPSRLINNISPVRGSWAFNPYCLHRRAGLPHHLPVTHLHLGFPHSHSCGYIRNNHGTGPSLQTTSHCIKPSPYMAPATGKEPPSSQPSSTFNMACKRHATGSLNLTITTPLTNLLCCLHRSAHRRGLNVRR
jgi:hypothetical protein